MRRIGHTANVASLNRITSYNVCYTKLLRIDILANDFDTDGSLLPATVTVLNNPDHGTISNINPSTGAVTYAPNSNFHGTDNFTYSVT